jgi:hypothetical protein
MLDLFRPAGPHSELTFEQPERQQRGVPFVQMIGGYIPVLQTF